MNELKTITKLVMSILEEDKQARNSDSYLYLKVVERVGAGKGIITAWMTLPYFLENMKRLGFPPFESVRRTRQKIQRQYPELAASDKVKGFRQAEEAKYYAYALDGSVGNGRCEVDQDHN